MASRAKVQDIYDLYDRVSNSVINDLKLQNDAGILEDEGFISFINHLSENAIEDLNDRADERNRVPGVTHHVVTAENINAEDNHEAVMGHILDEVAEAINFKYQLGKGERLDADKLKMILRTRDLENMELKIPDTIYRGEFHNYDEDGVHVPTEMFDEQAGGYVMDTDPLERGFGILDQRPGKDNKVSFVSPDPATAASYGRGDSKFIRSRDKFGNEYNGEMPANWAEHVYAIRTAGLDPSLFSIDWTATAPEAKYGPQFIYNGAIPQERITITDSAGNKREVNRIERQNFNSDKRLKRILKRRFD